MHLPTTGFEPKWRDADPAAVLVWLGVPATGLATLAGIAHLVAGIVR